MTDAITRMTGGLALAHAFAAHNVGPIFGMGGFQLLPFYDGIRRLGITHHLINDERTGIFAADAWARSTNRPGVCDATLGPGATNLATGLVEALNAGTPLIAVVGDAHRAHAGKNMTQEGRQVDILRPACKELIRVESVERIPELVRRAHLVATSGRPGPVVLDIPEDVSHGEYDFPADAFWVDPAALDLPSRRSRPAADAIQRAAEILRTARRPLLLVGGGVHWSGAYDALAKLAETLQAPVANTLSGKGAVACTDDLSAGLFGRFSRYANELIASADCLIAVGCKLGEIATKRYELLPSQTPLIQLDIVAEEIGRWAPVAVGLVGDARLGLEDLDQALLPDDDDLARDRAAWRDEHRRQRVAWQEQAAERYASEEIPINVGRLLGELNAALPDDGVLVADGGFASHWGGLLFDTKRAGRHFIADRGFASIGYGVPGGLGAALAGKGPVVAVTGDGGANMSIGDLETVVRTGAPLVLVVINNAASGYVKALQHAVFGAGSYQSSDLVEIDYAAVGRAYGCAGIRVERPEQLGAALREAIASGQPTIVDVIVTRDPASMLPAADSRAPLAVRAGDRPV